MLEVAVEALTLLLRPENFVFLGLGVLVGTVIGVLPGLGGTVGMSILLPFIFGMDPIAGLALLIGMDAITETSDTFTSVMLGVPGSSSSQAVIMDGYPMAVQGRVGEALGSAFLASLLGGLLGAVTLFLAVFAARPIVLAFGSPQLLMLVLLGLSMVGILSRGAAVAGLLSGFIGLILGAVGGAPTTPVYRFTFDQIYLFDGISLTVLAIGLFAVPELLDLLAQGRAIAEGKELDVGDRGRMYAGMRETLRHKWLVVRSSIMGSILGIIPGLGGSVAGWVTYGIAAQTSKNNENFGKGDIRGVIAPEAANNAQEGGTLVPTMLFGVPGSGSSAVLLGGLILLGLQPGPSMLQEDLPILLSMGWMLALANVMGAVLCLFLSRWIVKFTTVRAQYFAPFLFVILTVGAYQSSRHWGDIILMVAIGAIGWIMKQIGWPRAPLLIGFVLSVAAERYLWITVGTYGWLSWLWDPGVLIIAVLTIFVLLSGLRLSRRVEGTDEDVERTVSGSAVDDSVD